MTKPYIGSKICKLSGRGAFTIPPFMLEAMMARSPTWVIFIGPDEIAPCLVVVDPALMLGKLLHARHLVSGQLDEKVRWRREFGFLEAIRFDRSGRLTIPPALRECGQLEAEVLIIAAGDRIELWNPALARASMDEDVAWLAAINATADDDMTGSALPTRAGMPSAGQMPARSFDRSDLHIVANA